jgi:hypothetical protein
MATQIRLDRLVLAEQLVKARPGLSLPGTVAEVVGNKVLHRGKPASASGCHLCTHIVRFQLRFHCLGRRLADGPLQDKVGRVHNYEVDIFRSEPRRLAWQYHVVDIITASIRDAQIPPKPAKTLFIIYQQFSELHLGKSTDATTL